MLHLSVYHQKKP